MHVDRWVAEATQSGQHVGDPAVPALVVVLHVGDRVGVVADADDHEEDALVDAVPIRIVARGPERR